MINRRNNAQAHPLLAALVYSNIWISMGAAGLYAATLKLFPGLQWSWAGLSFSFFGTLFLYNLQRYAGLSDEKKYIDGSMLEWMQGHRKLVVLLMVLGALVSGISFLLMAFNSKLIVGLAAVITLLYGMPFKPIPGTTLRLRDFGWLKPAFVGFIWGIITVALPLNEGGVILFDSIGNGVFLTRCLLIWGLTLPFDIRDLPFDRVQLRYPTIPVVLGVKWTKWLAAGLFVIASISCILILFDPIIMIGFDSEFYILNGLSWQIAIWLTSLVSLAVIYPITEQHRDMYYLFVVDACLLVYWVVVWVVG